MILIFDRSLASVNCPYNNNIGYVPAVAVAVEGGRPRSVLGAPAESRREWKGGGEEEEPSPAANGRVRVVRRRS